MPLCGDRNSVSSLDRRNMVRVLSKLLRSASTAGNAILSHMVYACSAGRRVLYRVPGIYCKAYRAVTRIRTRACSRAAPERAVGLYLQPRLIFSSTPLHGVYYSQYCMYWEQIQYSALARLFARGWQRETNPCHDATGTRALQGSKVNAYTALRSMVKA